MGEIVNNLTSSIIKKTLMAMSGLVLAGFILIHAAGNATTFFGKDVFNTYAHNLHSFDAILPVFEMILGLFFILHIGLAAVIYLENRAARPIAYAVKKDAGGSTFASKTMPYTGLIIFIFILVHLQNFHNSSITPPSLMVKMALHDPLRATFYLTALLALVMHISHGLWSMFQTFGVSSPKYNRCINKSALFTSLCVGAIFIIITILCLLSTNFLA